MSEIRAIRAEFDQNQPNKVFGYAIRFNEWANITDFVQGRIKTFREVVRPNSIELGDMKVYWQHDRRNVLASQSGNTAKFRVDDVGLYVEATLPESALREREAVVRGDVDGFSFCFSVQKDKWTGNERELLDIKVSEVRVCSRRGY